MTRKFTRRAALTAGTGTLGASLLGVSPVTADETDGATLYAGRDVPVGTVRIEQDGHQLAVTFDTADSAWALTEAYLHVATDVDGIPTNGGGNPRIGHFDRAREPDGATDAIEFADISVEDGVERVVLAAHAEVGRGERTEGAWAGSEPMDDRGNWARYFEYALAEREPGIRGTIYEPDGEPGTEDRLVFLGPRGADDFDFGSIYTDETGTFSTKVAEPGTYSLGYYQRERWNVDTPERDGSPDVFTLGPVEVEDGVADLGRIDLPDAHLLDVRVVDEDGTPVADAPVNFYDQGSWGISRKHTTNADGYFQYDGLAETGIELLGEVTIQVWEPGTDPEPGNYALQRRIELDGPRTEELVLEGSSDDPGDTLAISGTIYDPAGDPATDDRIAVSSRSTFENVRTGDDGRFSAEVDGDETYSIGYYQQSDGPGSGPVRDGAPDIYAIDRVDAEADSIDIGEVHLPEAYPLDVRVVDGSGNPIDGAPVSVYSCTSNSCWGSGRHETTAAGYYQHRSLDETGAELVGDARIMVWDPDETDPSWGNRAIDRELEVTEAQTEELVLDG